MNHDFSMLIKSDSMDEKRTDPKKQVGNEFHRENFGQDGLRKNCGM